MSHFSLEDKINEYGNPVDMLYNSQVGPFVFPIPSENTNWRDEQEAWRQSACLFDLSYHMTDVYIEGPDTHRLISETAVNSLKNFGRDKARQLVVTNYDGYVIGDAIMFGLEDEKINIVGRPTASNWLEYRASIGSYDVEIERDERSLFNPKGRKQYRYQIQGPNAWQILEKLNGGPLPDLSFFSMGEIRVAGQAVRSLRHGMAGAPGLELFGPMEDGERVKNAIHEIGEEFGLLEAGARAYATVAQESGWIPSPVPAVYSGEKMKPYREWLPGHGFEANASIGGSFVSDNIEDYYLTPWDLGYGHLVKFDHDYIGRDALKMMKHQPHRKKVTLVWSPEDVTRIFSTLFQTEDRAKFMDVPASQYATCPYDMVLLNGDMVGISTYPDYTSNFRRWISLAMVDESVGNEGTEVTIVWGEPHGGSAKPVVERHVQTRVRATVAPSPIDERTRQSYRK